MERSNNGVGVLAVCAVSWSVALLSFQLHKRLLSDFMKKIDSELHSEERYDYQSRKVKKVRFAEDVVEPSSDNKEYRRRKRNYNKGGGTRSSRVPNGNDDRSWTENRRTEEEGDQIVRFNRRQLSHCADEDNNSSMPLNRQVLYRGIIEHRMLKAGHNLPTHFY